MKLQIHDQRDIDAVGLNDLRQVKDVINKLGKAEQAEYSSKSLKNARMQAASIVLGHFGDLIENLVSDEINISPEADQIIVCLTTGGSWGIDSKYGNSKKHLYEGRTRYLLFSQVHRELSDEQLKAIFTMTIGQAEMVLDCGKGLSYALRSIFFPVPIEYLPTLSVLCQGYLAVHAANQGHDEQIAMPEVQSSASLLKSEERNEGTLITNWHRQEPSIAAALQMMHWHRLQDSNSFAFRDELSHQLDKVNKADWWLRSFNVLDGSGQVVAKSWREAVKQIELEWKVVKGELIADEVAMLLKEIVNETDATRIAPQLVGKVYPQLVAKAYLKIAERLGAGK